MKLRSALVIIDSSARGARRAPAIAYPYVAEPIRKPAPRSTWPFAPTRRPAPKPERHAAPTPTPAAGGGDQLDADRTSRSRVVERVWEDPFRKQLEVNLGMTTESNLYADIDLRIANGGVFIATYQDLRPDTRVALQITLPGGHTTSAHGRVTLKRESLEAFGDPGPGVYVAFELLSHEALALLEQFASLRAPWLIEDD